MEVMSESVNMFMNMPLNNNNGTRRRPSTAETLDFLNFHGTDRPRQPSFSGILSVGGGMVDLIAPSTFSNNNNDNLNTINKLNTNADATLSGSALECCNKIFNTATDMLEHYEKEHVGNFKNELINNNSLSSVPEEETIGDNDNNSDENKENLNNIKLRTIFPSPTPSSNKVPNESINNSNSNDTITLSNKLQAEQISALPLTPPMDFFTPTTDDNMNIQSPLIGSPFNAYSILSQESLPPRPSSTPAMLLQQHHQQQQQHGFISSPLTNQISQFNNPFNTTSLSNDINSSPSWISSSPQMNLQQQMHHHHHNSIHQQFQQQQFHQQQQQQQQQMLLMSPLHSNLTINANLMNDNVSQSNNSTPIISTPSNDTLTNGNGNGNGGISASISSSGRKVYRCPKAFCSKIYKNSNGLRYHLEHGNCELYFSGGAIDPDSREITPGAAGARAVAQSAQLQRQRARQARQMGNDPLNTNNNNNNNINDGNMMMMNSQLPVDIKIALRPYWCKVNGCGKKYKNLNGLKYHAKISHPYLDFKKEVKGHTSLC